MMVSRPYEANLRRKNPKCNLSKIQYYLWSIICFGWVETGFPLLEGAKPKAEEARNGLKRALKIEKVM